MIRILLLYVSFLFFLIFISCGSQRRFNKTLTAKGCNIDSVRMQSEQAFKKADKKRRIPAGVFKTIISENDTAIYLQRVRSDGDIRNWGGMNIRISKQTCTVTFLEVIQ